MNNSYYRSLILGVDNKIPLIDGTMVNCINLDNAATTPPFKTVVSDILNILPNYSSIHRGMGYKSQFSSKIYEETRMVVSKFLGVNQRDNSIIFVNNSTHGLNMLSNILYPKYKDSIVLSTDMEHHSNDLPWRKYKLDYIPVDDLGQFSLSNLESKLKYHNGKVKLVTMTGASNVTGYKTPIYEAAKIIHKYGAKIIVDGAQLVPHCPIFVGENCMEDHIDYLVFSAHKLYAPFGSGVLVGPKNEFNNLEPDYKGGGTVDMVSHDLIMWLDSPSRNEAGSPNLIGIAALSSSINVLNSLNMCTLEDYEVSLCNYTLEKLSKIKDIKLFCTKDPPYGRIGVIPFIIDGVHHEIISKALSYEGGISVRSGCFCAQPYVQKLLGYTRKDIDDIIKYNLSPGIVRISFGMYNNFNEIDKLIKILNNISLNKKYYIDKYSKISENFFF